MYVNIEEPANQNWQQRIRTQSDRGYLVSNTDQILNSLKGELESKHKWSSSTNSPAQSHEQDTQTINFCVSESEQDSFPFTQIRHMKLRQDAIYIQTYSALIEIKGKDLNTLYSQLRRYKLSNISVSKDKENIESITIQYNDEED